MLMILSVVGTSLSPVIASPQEALGQTTDTTGTVKDEGGWLERAIAAIVSIPINVFKYVTEKSLKFESIGVLVFGQGDDANYLPWKESELKFIQTWYMAISAISLPFLLVIVVWNGFKMVASGINPAMRAETIASLYRMVGVIFIVALAPLMVDVLFRMSDLLVNGISTAMTHVSSALNIPHLSSNSMKEFRFDEINIITGSILGTVLVELGFLLLFVWFNIIYTIRMLNISVMLGFTPLMALMWATNKNVNAMAIWAGELASNVFMPVAHALVLCFIMGFVDVTNVSDGTWVHILIFMYTLIPLSEVLRNSMQGLLTRASGMDEAVTARGVLGGLSSAVGVASIGRVASATIKGRNIGGGSASPMGGGGGGLQPSFVTTSSIPSPGNSPGIGNQPMARKIGFNPESVSPDPTGGSSTSQGVPSQNSFNTIRQQMPSYVMRAASVAGGAMGMATNVMSGMLPGGKAIGDVLASGFEGSSRFVAMSGIMTANVLQHKRQTGHGIVESARETMGVSGSGIANTVKAVGRMGQTAFIAAQDRDTGGQRGLQQLESYKQPQQTLESSEAGRKIGFQYSPPSKGMT